MQIQGGSRKQKEYILDISNLVPGNYSLAFVIRESGQMGTEMKLDALQDIYNFLVTENLGFNHDMQWQSQWWGHICNGFIEEI